MLEFHSSFAPRSTRAGDLSQGEAIVIFWLRWREAQPDTRPDVLSALLAPQAFPGNYLCNGV